MCLSVCLLVCACVRHCFLGAGSQGLYGIWGLRAEVSGFFRRLAETPVPFKRGLPSNDSHVKASGPKTLLYKAFGLF